MNTTSRTEYGLTEDHPSRTQPNKVFRCVPAQDGLTETILRARREVITDGKLTNGAARLFVLLLDWSLWPGKNKGPGVVTISTTKLRELLGASKRALFGWKRELVKRGVIWITNHYMPNSNPMHTYHIAALHQKDHGGHLVTEDGLWGNGSRRQLLPLSDHGTRWKKRSENGSENHHNNGEGGLVQKSNQGVKSGKPKQSSKKGTLGGAKKAPWEEQKRHPARSKKGTLPGAKKAPCQEQKRTPARSKKGHLGGAKNGTCQEQKTAPIGETLDKRFEGSEKGGTAIPPQKAALEVENKELTAWEKSMSDSYPSAQRSILARLEKERAKVGSDDLLDRKIAFLENKVLGPKSKTAVSAQPKPARKAPEEKPLTDAELLEGCAYLVECGRADDMTTEQQRVWATHGRSKGGPHGPP